MIRHITTLLWNTRRSSLLLLLQIFLAFLILFGIFSFAGSNFANFSTPLGFNVSKSYIINIDLPDGVDSSAKADLFQRSRMEVLPIPGVKSASLVGGVTPFSNSNWGYGSQINGSSIWTRLFMADENFMETAEIELSAGRWYTAEDTIGGNWAVVVTEKFVETNFPHSSPLDSTFSWFNEAFEGRQATIVGIVKNFKYRGEFYVEEPLTFIPQNPWESEWSLMNMVVRVDGSVGAEIEEEIYNRVSQVVKSRESAVVSMEKRRKDTSQQSWIPIIALLSICGFLVANVALGLFGILINAISKRRGEIGLRKALGATGSSITSQFTLEVLLVAVAGILLGSIIAVQIPLFELIALENRFFWIGGILAAALILVLVILCALIPSNQASKIHPAVALRED